MPRSRTEDPREAILDQLAYLLDEVEALEPLIARVPEPILSGRPMEGDLSIKQIYGIIASADEQVRLPRFQRIVAEEGPQLSGWDERALVAQEAWDEMEIGAVLGRVRAAREALVGFLRALPAVEWTRTGLVDGRPLSVYDLAFGITQEDTDYLRALGYRLHESRLTSRMQDLPK